MINKWSCSILYQYFGMTLLNSVICLTNVTVPQCSPLPPVQSCDTLLVQCSDTESGLDEKILYECLRYLESCLDKPVPRKAFK